MLPTTYDRLSDADVARGLAALPGWSVEDGHLTRTWDFASYADGVLFAAMVAGLAERMDHHPDIMIGYQKVRVAVLTHSAGGLTGMDFELARRIDAA